MELRKNFKDVPVPKGESKNSKSVESKSNIHKDHRSRLKMQYSQNGIHSLTDVQKLELLLFYAIPQKDTNPIAHALLDEFGSIKDVLLAEPRALKKINGIKDNTAMFLKLVHDITNLKVNPGKNEVISSVVMAKEFASKLFVGASVEQFYVICLTKNKAIKKVQMIESGTVDEVNVQIRNITEFALDCKCNQIIVCHNHPYGYGQASDEDCTFTYSLLCSCLLNSIDIIDHIIVGQDKTIAMSGGGLLAKLKERAYENIRLPKNKILFLSSLSEGYDISEDYPD